MRDEDRLVIKKKSAQIVELQSRRTGIPRDPVVYEIDPWDPVSEMYSTVAEMHREIWDAKKRRKADAARGKTSTQASGGDFKK